MPSSNQLFNLAQTLFPGGVNSPVRAFRGVGGEPFFVKRGQGAYLVDVEGREYVDYIGSWGALVAGHAHPAVLKKVTETLQNGLSFGAPTELEIALAQTIRSMMPSIEMLRFVSSGTESVMSAIRVARGFTKRDKIIKFAGCYHGHTDALLVRAGSGCLTFGVPDSLGVPASFTEHTFIAEFNNLENVAALFKAHGDEIACVIIEPVAGNMNCILPVEGFLKGLRALCDQHGSLLIFDEVMTGFRVALGGAQQLYGVTPDLTTLGKIIGGGMPVGAYGGRVDVMRSVAPLGAVYQAGTLSGNPIGMAAGLATLELVQAPHFYEALTAQTTRLAEGLMHAAGAANINSRAVSIGGMFGLFFMDAALPQNEQETKRADVATFKRFFHAMLEEGVYFAHSAFE